MTRMKLTGYNMAAISRIVEDTALKSTAPADYEFQVGYTSYARAIVTYAILHGYKVEARRADTYTFFVTLHIDQVRPKSLVSDVMDGLEESELPYCPEFVGY